jgi:hypothetical protein
MRLRYRRLSPCFVIALAMAALATAAVAEPADAGLRHWAFGWDPGLSQTGLTVRYRPLPDWDVSVAAGPNDYRRDLEKASQNWEDGVPSESGQWTNNREESGWVRLAAGRRFWREDRVSVSGVCSVFYTWSAQEDRYREYDTYSNPYADYVNRRYHYDVDTWALGLSIRPSVRISPRMQVEFEGGLHLARSSSTNEFEKWWDSAPGYTLEQETVNTHFFRTFGGFELSYLKFIFWF